jgi:hypothetical protein
MSPVIEARRLSLSPIFVGGETLETALDDKAANDALELGPDNGEVRNGGVGDPVFAAVQPIAAVDRLGLRLHRGGIGAAVGFGQAETADQFAGRHPGQEPHLLLLGAEGIDRIHGQRRLDAHGRPVPRIDRLDLARDQAIGHVADARAAVLFGQHGAEKAHLAKLGHDGAVEGLVTEGGDHAGQKLLAGVGPGRLLDGAFVLGQPAGQVERVVPFEGLGGGGGAVGHEVFPGLVVRGVQRIVTRCDDPASIVARGLRQNERVG